MEAAAHIASLAVRDQRCESDAAACDAAPPAGGAVGPLSQWAGADPGWDRLLSSVSLYEVARHAYQQGQHDEGIVALEESLALRLFAYADQATLDRWQQVRLGGRSAGQRAAAAAGAGADAAVGACSRLGRGGAGGAARCAVTQRRPPWSAAFAGAGAPWQHVQEAENGSGQHPGAAVGLPGAAGAGGAGVVAGGVASACMQLCVRTQLGVRIPAPPAGVCAYPCRKLGVRPVPQAGAPKEYCGRGPPLFHGSPPSVWLGGRERPCRALCKLQHPSRSPPAPRPTPPPPQEQQDVDDLTEATELLNLATALLKAADELVPDSVDALRRRAETVRGAARAVPLPRRLAAPPARRRFEAWPRARASRLVLAAWRAARAIRRRPARP